MIKLTMSKPVWLFYLFLGVIYFLGATYVAIADDITPVVTHGVAAGDVTPSSGVIWARGSSTGFMHVSVSRNPNGLGSTQQSVRVHSADDYTGKLLLNGLEPDTAYYYRVWFTAEEAKQNESGKKATEAVGRFRTAPAVNQIKPVVFAWGGDLAGQNVCRDSTQGFPIFNAINALSLDFFIGLGDMIYADGICAAIGRYGNNQIPGNFVQAADLASFWAHWKYNREDHGYRTLLAQTPYYAVWDDHEVVNDFGPLHDTRTAAPYSPGAHLLPLGLKAFLDYNPTLEYAGTPKRLYRSLRWGKHLEVFFLDTRQYRDANAANDSAERPKTMLGREQLVWLKQRLSESDATWKVLASSVPLSIPTGFPPQNGRDGWANFDQSTGFEQEMLDIQRHLQQHKIYNAVWITTDVHFAEIFRYTPFSDTAAFQIHEFVSGPLNAGLFPNRDFDITLGTESLFFFGPDGSDAGLSYTQARSFMNFGTVQVDATGRLTAAIRDVNGTIKYQTTLAPVTQH